jgi:hypothetical protein
MPCCDLAGVVVYMMLPVDGGSSLVLKPGQLTTTPWSEEEGIQLADYRYILYKTYIYRIQYKLLAVYIVVCYKCT